MLGYWCLIQRLTLYVIQQPSGLLYLWVLAIVDHTHRGSVLIPIAPLSRSASRCTSEVSRACTSPFHAFSIARLPRFVKPKRNVFSLFTFISVLFRLLFNHPRRHTQMKPRFSSASTSDQSMRQLRPPGQPRISRDAW